MTRDGRSRPPELVAGGVQVFLCAPDPADSMIAGALLDDDERARAERFVFARDRVAYVAAHALLRQVLARHAGTAPNALVFLAGPHGRPELAAPAGTGLRFNLAHTPGLVGCAVTRDRAVGFDVEAVRRPAPLEVADGFAPSERAGLAALAPEARDDRFFALWALKEAYLKGRGLGLSLALDAFAVAPDGDEARLDAPDGPWTLRHRRLPGHHAAVAVAAPPETVQVSWFTDQRVTAVG